MAYGQTAAIRSVQSPTQGLFRRAPILNGSTLYLRDLNQGNRTTLNLTLLRPNSTIIDRPIQFKVAAYKGDLFALKEDSYGLGGFSVEKLALGKSYSGVTFSKIGSSSGIKVSFDASRWQLNCEIDDSTNANYNIPLSASDHSELIKQLNLLTEPVLGGEKCKLGGGMQLGYAPVQPSNVEAAAPDLGQTGQLADLPVQPALPFRPAQDVILPQQARSLSIKPGQTVIVELPGWRYEIHRYRDEYMVIRNGVEIGVVQQKNGSYRRLNAYDLFGIVDGGISFLPDRTRQPGESFVIENRYNAGDNLPVTVKLEGPANPSFATI